MMTNDTFDALWQKLRNKLVALTPDTSFDDICDVFGETATLLEDVDDAFSSNHPDRSERITTAIGRLRTIFNIPAAP